MNRRSFLTAAVGVALAHSSPLAQPLRPDLTITQPEPSGKALGPAPGGMTISQWGEKHRTICSAEL
jgi:hypothetical protein